MNGRSSPRHGTSSCSFPIPDQRRRPFPSPLSRLTRSTVLSPLERLVDLPLENGLRCCSAWERSGAGENQNMALAAVMRAGARNT
jgi:hypothetical protein